MSAAGSFILSTFTPKLAVFSTPSANTVANKNNLTVTQLLAPFSKVLCDVSWQEPANNQILHPKGLKLTFVDVANKKKADLDSASSRRLLQNVISSNLPSFEEGEGASTVPDGTKSKSNVRRVGRVNYKVDVAPRSFPWFTAWRKEFLRIQAESQSIQCDYLSHFMACVLVMSSEDGGSPEAVTETVAKLSKAQQQHQITWPTCWAFPNVLKIYLVLHEKGGMDQEKAEAMYQSLRTTYGGNFCYMVQFKGITGDDNANETNDHRDLWKDFVERKIEIPDRDDMDDIVVNHEDVNLDVVINSELDHPLSPDADKGPPSMFPQNGNGTVTCNVSSNGVYGQNLSDEDLQSLQATVNEISSKALLPYIDRQSRLLYETIINRRGISKSIFSATKRLFGGSAKSPSSIVYTNESLEMMSRKLADVYFLFGHYAGSYQLYHQLKKDFLGDSAWIYYASSLEMAAVSHFMMSQVEPPLAATRAFPVHYVSEAITYFVENCRMTDAAMKCALICCECLTHMENYPEAAAIFIKMTTEDCDLKSALMLEQAAHSFLNVNYIRKYALHCVLAGHRYAKAGFKTHSLKCYLQADQIYTTRGWKYAEDHVHCTIVRHNTTLNLMNDDDILRFRRKVPDEPVVQPPPIITPPPQVLTFSSEENSSQVQLQNSVKVEYFTQKLVNATTFIGLVRLHNTTSDFTATIKEISFSNSNISVQVLQNDNANISPMESQNIVLQAVCDKLGVEQNDLHLLLSWELSKQGTDTVPGKSKVLVEDLSKLLKSEESAFVFGFNHPSTCKNDFNISPCMFVTIELLVYSRISGKYTFKIERNSSQSYVGPDSKAPGEEVMMVGQTVWQLDVVPFNTYNLKYTVALLHPGVFNVAPTISVTNSQTGTPVSFQKYLLHSPLVVSHTSGNS